MEIYKRETASYDEKYHVAYGKGFHMNLIKYIVNDILETFQRTKRFTHIMHNIRYTALSKHVDELLVMQLREPIFSLYHRHDAYIIRITDVPADRLFLDIDQLHLKNLLKYRFKLGSYYQWAYKGKSRLY